MKIHIVRMVIILIAAGSLSISHAQPEGRTGIGDFDISKVQQAVAEQQDTSPAGGEYVPLESNEANPDSYAIVILRMVGYLAIIIGLIFGVAWLVRKVGLAGASKIGGGSMDILEVLSFGQNRSAMLVRVLDCVYLLGQTPGSMVLLEKIEGQKALDLIASSQGGGSVIQFKDAFNAFMGKLKKPV